MNNEISIPDFDSLPKEKQEEIAKTASETLQTVLGLTKGQMNQILFEAYNQLEDSLTPIAVSEGVNYRGLFLTLALCICSVDGNPGFFDKMAIRKICSIMGAPYNGTLVKETLQVFCDKRFDAAAYLLQVSAALGDNIEAKGNLYVLAATLCAYDRKITDDELALILMLFMV